MVANALWHVYCDIYIVTYCDIYIVTCTLWHILCDIYIVHIHYVTYETTYDILFQHVWAIAPTINNQHAYRFNSLLYTCNIFILCDICSLGTYMYISISIYKLMPTSYVWEHTWWHTHFDIYIISTYESYSQHHVCDCDSHLQSTCMIESTHCCTFVTYPPCFTYKICDIYICVYIYMKNQCSQRVWLHTLWCIHCNMCIYLQMKFNTNSMCAIDCAIRLQSTCIHTSTLIRPIAFQKYQRIFVTYIIVTNLQICVRVTYISCDTYAMWHIMLKPKNQIFIYCSHYLFHVVHLP